MSNLHKNVSKAAAVRGMCNTEGYTILMKEVDKEVARISEKVLDVTASDEQVLTHRREAQVYVALKKLLKKIMLTGEFSARALENLEDSAKAE